MRKYDLNLNITMLDQPVYSKSVGLICLVVALGCVVFWSKFLSNQNVRWSSISVIRFPSQNSLGWKLNYIDNR